MRRFKSSSDPDPVPFELWDLIVDLFEFQFDANGPMLFYGFARGSFLLLV